MTEDEAAAAVAAYLATEEGTESQVAVMRVEDAGRAWRVVYNTKAFAESGDPRHSLAGNWPYLVVKADGAVSLDGEYREAALGPGEDVAALAGLLDPGATRILTVDNPWDAYRSALDLRGPVLDAGVPHDGAVYGAWAGLTDVFETGKTPVDDAHYLLRKAAARWLDRPGPPTDEHVARWIAYANRLATGAFERDGDFWREPGTPRADEGTTR